MQQQQQPLSSLLLLLLVAIASSSSGGVLSTTFTVTNKCSYAIWPGILSNAGSAPLATTGFALAPAESRVLDAPVPWSGRLFARTLCSTDPATGRLSCATADCGSGAVECNGGGAAPPATLAEFTLGGSAGTDFFDVSLVDGFNIPVLVTPQRGAPGGEGTGRCVAAGCGADVDAVCPPELRVTVAEGGGERVTVACRSACGAFGTPRYCCSGEFGTPDACGPTTYSLLFKSACPSAYSYAYDDATSTFTCPTAATSGYTVTFCPGATSVKSNPEAADFSPTVNNSNAQQVLFGTANMESSLILSPSWPPLLSLLLACILF